MINKLNNKLSARDEYGSDIPGYLHFDLKLLFWE